MVKSIDLLQNEIFVPVKFYVMGEIDKRNSQIN